MNKTKLIGCTDNAKLKNGNVYIINKGIGNNEMVSILEAVTSAENHVFCNDMISTTLTHRTILIISTENTSDELKASLSNIKEEENTNIIMHYDNNCDIEKVISQYSPSEYNLISVIINNISRIKDNFIQDNIELYFKSLANKYNISVVCIKQQPRDTDADNIIFINAV